MKDLFSLIKDFQKIKARIDDMKEQLKNRTVEGSAGAGMVKVVANGAQEIISIEIEEEAFKSLDKEMIQDLIAAAVNDAIHKSKEMMEEELKNMATSFGLPLSGLLK